MAKLNEETTESAVTNNFTDKAKDAYNKFTGDFPEQANFIMRILLGIT